MARQFQYCRNPIKYERSTPSSFFGRRGTSFSQSVDTEFHFDIQNLALTTRLDDFEPLLNEIPFPTVGLSVQREKGNEIIIGARTFTGRTSNDKLDHGDRTLQRQISMSKLNFQTLWEIKASQTIASKRGKGPGTQNRGLRHGRGLKLSGIDVLMSPVQDLSLSCGSNRGKIVFDRTGSRYSTP